MQKFSNQKNTEFNTKLILHMNVVESNNDFVNNNAFVQVWSSEIFVDEIPDEPPLLANATRKRSRQNADKTVCTLYYYNNTDRGSEYEYLVYVDNLQLTREFRQKENWRVVLNDETDIRNIIFPGKDTYRLYTPSFTNGEYSIAYTAVNPEFDLQNCYLTTKTHYDKLYINCWFYLGKKLSDFGTPPFSDSNNLLKGTDSFAKIKTASGESNTYYLPPDNLGTTDVDESKQMFVTTKNISTVLTAIGNLDEGEYW